MLSFLALLALFLVVVAILLGWASLLGWVLTLILPLEFFEGTLLAMLATGGAGLLIYAFYKAFAPPDDFPLGVEPPIPSERFFPSEEEQTWEKWLRYQFADAIYVEFEAEDIQSETLDETQIKEIAIRLAHVGADVVKRRAERGRVRSVTVSQLKNQMQQSELQPYDDDIMRAAMRGINDALATTLIVRILSENLWDERLPKDSLFI